MADFCRDFVSSLLPGTLLPVQSEMYQGGRLYDTDCTLPVVLIFAQNKIYSDVLSHIKRQRGETSPKTEYCAIIDRKNRLLGYPYAPPPYPRQHHHHPPLSLAGNGQVDDLAHAMRHERGDKT